MRHASLREICSQQLLFDWVDDWPVVYPIQVIFFTGFFSEQASILLSFHVVCIRGILKNACRIHSGFSRLIGMILRRASSWVAHRLTSTSTEWRRPAPTAADQIGADWRRPILRRVGWRGDLRRPEPSGADRRRPDWRRLAPTDSDRRRHRLATTLYYNARAKQATHTHTHTHPVSLYIFKAPNGVGFQRLTPVQV